jgi:hypothetical protein
MAERDKKDREAWTPRIERDPLFTNSADFERGLGEASNPPDIDVADEGAEDTEEDISPSAANPFIKPQG